MINRKQAKKYCCEKISLIENYDKAKADLLETWDLHHRKEDEGYSVQDLKDNGLYHKRPASELIFLKHSEHMSLHNKGVHRSEEHRRKIGESHKGKYVSEEARRKMSLNHADFKGEKHPFYGKHHSEETKKKISEAHKGNKYCLGKKHSDEAKKKISEANKGKKHSEEAKKKMSEAHKGEKHHNYGKHLSEETRRKISLNHADFKGEKSHRSKPILQIDKKTCEVIKTWPCAAEVERVLGINHGSISQCCLGKGKSAGGYIWRYAS